MGFAGSVIALQKSCGSSLLTTIGVIGQNSW